MNDLSHIAPQSKYRGANKYWFAVYENCLDHPIVGMHVQPPSAADKGRAAMFPFMVWIWMCGEAAFRARDVCIQGQVFSLGRGQIVMSQSYLSTKANWSRKSVRVFLTKLARHGMIRLSTVARGGQMALDFDNPKWGQGRGHTLTIVTLCNYDVYQHRQQAKGPGLGPSRGQAGATIPTSDTLQSTQSNQSRRDSITKESNQSAAAGTDWTDNVVPLRPGPMVMDAPGVAFAIPEKTKAKIEQLGVDPEEMLDRMHEQIDKGRKIGSKSRYLMKAALNEAHERTGTPIDVLKAMISGNQFARQAAMIVAATAKPEPTEADKRLRARMSAPKSARAELLKTLRK